MTGLDVAEKARLVYLNRAGVSDTSLLPIINDEFEELWQVLVENDVPFVNKVFAAITITVGATSISSPGPPTLPADLLEPISLEERASGSTSNSDYVRMKERRFLPNANAVSTLDFWTWQGDQINLIGATTSREVRIKGVKAPTLLTKLQDTIPIAFVANYLAAATGAKAALTLLHNPNLAASNREIANERLSKLLSKYARKNQSLSVRRQGMRRRGF